MTPYRHVLCPVDFSACSLKALSWSTRFSKEAGARLTVLHVVDTQMLSIGNLVAVPADFDQARQKAGEAVARLKRRPDLAQASVEIAEGVPANIITNAASHGDVDLLVMGTHGLSGLEKSFVGSVTENVLHRVRVPFLALSPRAPEPPEEDRSPGTFLMAIDFGPETRSVVRYGIWLAEHFRARILAVHAVYLPVVNLELMSPSEVERLIASVVSKRRKELDAVLAETSRSPRETMVRLGAPYDTLRDVVEERSVDLLILGAGGHGDAPFRWVGSTCHRMLRLAPCPVLVVRAF
jgi:nucleotide-binding universal stress UspA family protein